MIIYIYPTLLHDVQKEHVTCIFDTVECGLPLSDENAPRSSEFS